MLRRYCGRGPYHRVLTIAKSQPPTVSHEQTSACASAVIASSIMTTFLQQVKAEKLELVRQKRRLGRALPPRAKMPPPFGWSGFGVIAEIKRASPSKGDIADHPLEAWASGLERGGAKALSVLTEEKHFKGHLEFLPRVRLAAPQTPILRKDFIVDELELDEAVSYGASAVLLIVAMLSGPEFNQLSRAAASRRLSVLAEVHDEGELDTAAAQSEVWIGINQRNLHSLAVDKRYAEKLVPRLGHTHPFVIESGLDTAADLHWARSLGARGVLVGEGLAKTPSPGDTLASWLAAIA